MTPLFASGRLVPLMRGRCDECTFMSVRNGICTEPMCSRYGVKS